MDIYLLRCSVSLYVCFYGSCNKAPPTAWRVNQESELGQKPKRAILSTRRSALWMGLCFEQAGAQHDLRLHARIFSADRDQHLQTSSPPAVSLPLYRSDDVLAKVPRPASDLPQPELGRVTVCSGMLRRNPASGGFGRLVVQSLLYCPASAEPMSFLGSYAASSCCEPSRCPGVCSL